MFTRHLTMVKTSTVGIDSPKLMRSRRRVGHEADEAGAVRFRLVNNSSADPSRGYLLEHAQLTLFVQDTIEH